MKNYFPSNFMRGFIFAFLSVLLITSINSSAQELPIITNERGDTIKYPWPISLSSLCIKDEIIIKFKKNALYLDKLCYTISEPSALEPSEDWYDMQKSIIMTEIFPVNEIIADSALKEEITKYGGIYLTRITSANPCTDTISISISGNRIESENYLWLKLKLNNDTSVIKACINLTMLYQYFLEQATPNFCGHFDTAPIDTYYGSNQISLNQDFINVEGAWDKQIGPKGGSYNINIGIIDDGVDFMHCDLGGSKKRKVYDGWDYANNRRNFSIGSVHGTPVAGIIGALTNGSYSCTNPGVAGIAGGWYTAPEWNASNYGCKLFGFKIDVVPEDRISIDKVIGAIRDAVSNYTFTDQNGKKNGYENHIINCSWGYEDTMAYLPDLQRAFNYAYEHGVSIVCSRGNFQGDRVQYPACFDPSWITSVGGHGSGAPPQLNSSSRWGEYVDFLAPSEDIEIYTTSYQGGWENFGYTSAAAPHVSGAIGLLRSEFLESPNPNNPDDIIPEPEDYENILKVAALDLDYDLPYTDPKIYAVTNYDNKTGWGQFRIGRLFEMFQEGYVLKHYEVQCNSPVPYPLENFNLEVIKEGVRNDCVPGQYNVRKRIVTGTLDIGNDWMIDNFHNLYVWGRNGRTNKGGFSSGIPLFLTSFTEVISGEGGNGIVPGIIHNNSTIVNAKTYQYELRDIATKQRIQDLPDNNNLKMYISVFGLPSPNSVDNIVYVNSKLSLVYPNPTSNSIKFRFCLEQVCSPVIKIYNSIGIIVYQENCNTLVPDIYEKVINVEEFPSGAYIIELNQNYTTVQKGFLIAK